MIYEPYMSKINELQKKLYNENPNEEEKERIMSDICNQLEKYYNQCGSC